MRWPQPALTLLVYYPLGSNVAAQLHEFHQRLSLPVIDPPPPSPFPIPFCCACVLQASGTRAVQIDHIRAHSSWSQEAAEPSVVAVAKDSLRRALEATLAVVPEAGTRAHACGYT